MSYDDLDRILKAIESRNFTNCNMEEVEKVKKMIKAKHKTQKLPVFLCENCGLSDQVERLIENES
ncbi:MAG: hypothetical protein OCU22_06255 [Canidatus Methanoxibalbensis ujae]|nr:hypothetical protein [Candidatus Methanoxibalbensis ujae]